jgi:hypothetical protein
VATKVSITVVTVLSVLISEVTLNVVRIVTNEVIGLVTVTLTVLGLVISLVITCTMLVVEVICFVVVEVTVLGIVRVGRLKQEQAREIADAATGLRYDGIGIARFARTVESRRTRRSYTVEVISVTVTVLVSNKVVDAAACTVKY